MNVDLRLYALVDPAIARGRTLADLAGLIAGDGGIDKRIEAKIDVHQFTFARAISVGPSRL